MTTESKLGTIIYGLAALCYAGLAAVDYTEEKKAEVVGDLAICAGSLITAICYAKN